MRLETSFDPIEPGEEDVFAIDFTADAGRAYILNVIGTLRMARYSEGFDPNPQSRVLEQQPLTIIYPSGGRQITGQFGAVRIGGIPATAAGGTYILEITAQLSDRRMISYNSTLPCVLPGQ